MLPDIMVVALSYSIDVVAIWQQSDLIENNQHSFYTDSNSLELVERMVDPNLNQTIPELTYPIQTLIGMQTSTNKSMTIIVQEPHGATAKPASGKIEVFI